MSNDKFSQSGHPDHFGGWDFVYKIVIMLWTIFGLSYIIMVVGFLMTAFTSKKVSNHGSTYNFSIIIY